MNLDILEKRVLEIQKTVQMLSKEIRKVNTPEHTTLQQCSASTDADIAKQREIARRMREARDKMPPLGMSIKEMVEEGRV